MKKVISISSDRNIFKEGSAVRARQIEYGQLFDELHIIVFTKLTSFLPTKVQIAPNVWVYGTHSLSKLLYMSQAAKIAGKIIDQKNFKPENSVVTVQDPFETGRVGSLIKKKFGLPLHVQIHTDFLNPFFAKEFFLNRLRVKMAKNLLPQADAVRVVSQRIADSISLNEGISLKSGVVPQVLPIFTDVVKMENAVPVVDLKKKYPQFNFIILIASRLTKEKNISFALRVFAKLLSAYPKIGLVIVGSGPEEPALKSLAKKLLPPGAVTSVVFEPWQNDLSSYYKTANLFLLTSNYEGYGLTLVEAIMSRCPVISTDVGIASEIFKSSNTSDGSTDACFVCPVGDMACFYDSVSKLVESPGLREKCVFDAREKLGTILIRDINEYLNRYQKSIEGIEGIA